MDKWEPLRKKKCHTHKESTSNKTHFSRWSTSSDLSKNRFHCYCSCTWISFNTGNNVIWASEQVGFSFVTNATLTRHGWQFIVTTNEWMTTKKATPTFRVSRSWLSLTFKLNVSFYYSLLVTWKSINVKIVFGLGFWARDKSGAYIDFSNRKMCVGPKIIFMFSKTDQM